jgi:hypothetical protein
VQTLVVLMPASASVLVLKTVSPTTVVVVVVGLVGTLLGHRVTDGRTEHRIRLRNARLARRTRLGRSPRAAVAFGRSRPTPAALKITGTSGEQDCWDLQVTDRPVRTHGAIGQTLLSIPAQARCCQVGMSGFPSNVDQVAIVIDWLDACRLDLVALLDLYVRDANLLCECERQKLYRGRSQLEEYWRSRLDGNSPNAFALQEIAPSSGGVELDYLSHEGKSIRVVFAFAADGKILQTHCRPAALSNQTHPVLQWPDVAGVA